MAASTSTLGTPAGTAWSSDPSMRFFCDEKSYFINGRSCTVVKELGSGASGIAYLITLDGKQYVAKLFRRNGYDGTGYHPLKPNSEIEEEINYYYPLAIREPQFYVSLYGGFAAGYSFSKPITYSIQGGKKIVTSQPYHCSLIPYIEGDRLTIYQESITHLDRYLRLQLAILRALQHLHTHFLHLDIYANNILIVEDKEGHIKAQFIDFTLSKNHGEFFIIPKDLSFSKKPPEYKMCLSLSAAARHDIYCTGLMLENIFSNHAGKFPSVKDALGILYDDMKTLFNMDDVLSRTESLLMSHCKPNLQINTFFSILIALSPANQKRFLDSNLRELSRMDTFLTLFFDKITNSPRFREIIEAHRCPYFEIFSVFIDRQIGLEQIKTFFIIFRLLNSEDQLLLLKNLSTLTTLTKMVADPQFFHERRKESLATQKILLTFLYQSKRTEYEANFSSNIGKWCYTQRLQQLEKKPDDLKVYDDLNAGFNQRLLLDPASCESDEKNHIGVDRLKEHALQNASDLFKILHSTPFITTPHVGEKVTVGYIHAFLEYIHPISTLLEDKNFETEFNKAHSQIQITVLHHMATLLTKQIETAIPPLEEKERKETDIDFRFLLSLSPTKQHDITFQVVEQAKKIETIIGICPLRPHWNPLLIEHVCLKTLGLIEKETHLKRKIALLSDPVLMELMILCKKKIKIMPASSSFFKSKTGSSHTEVTLSQYWQEMLKNSIARYGQVRKAQMGS